MICHECTCTYISTSISLEKLDTDVLAKVWQDPRRGVSDSQHVFHIHVQAQKKRSHQKRIRVYMYAVARLDEHTDIVLQAFISMYKGLAPVASNKDSRDFHEACVHMELAG